MPSQSPRRKAGPPENWPEIQKAQIQEVARNEPMPAPTGIPARYWTGDIINDEKVEYHADEPASVFDIVFTFTLVHYLFWLAVPAVVCWLLPSPWRWVAASVVAAGIFKSFDGSEKKMGRIWHAARMHTAWLGSHRYAKLRMIRTAKLDPNGQYIFPWSPHGILILSRIATYGGVFEAMFPGIRSRCLGASPVFAWPGSREVSLAMGAVDASRSVAHRVLASGRSLLLYPGGSREIFKTVPSSEQRATDVILQPRKGFVKLALQYGTPLVPVAVFGERDCYTKLSVPAAIGKWSLAVLRMPLLIFWGRWGTLMPRPEPLGVVFGSPLPVPCIADPSQADIDRVHGQYIAAYKSLWEDHKSKFGYEAEDTLNIL